MKVGEIWIQINNKMKVKILSITFEEFVVVGSGAKEELGPRKDYIVEFERIDGKGYAIKMPGFIFTEQYSPDKKNKK